MGGYPTRMDLAGFRAQFPEFGNGTTGATDTLVQAFLDASALEVDADVWDTLYDQGHGYLTAHRLALSPYGNGTRLQLAKGAGTTYWTHYQHLVTLVGAGVIVP